MSLEQKQIEQQPAVDLERALTQWPVSLFGSLGNRQATPTNQGWWPWLLCKAVVCPAALLGANETLFQEEEPADICCLQPHSFCGPTCRDLNAASCGFGNEGLKLFVHTCALQTACSCVCLGLPFVAWLAALQRQKVVGKHAVDDSHDDLWVGTAMYPCNLLQMHALLRQQQQLASHAAATYRAPTVQQMTAVDSVSQAPSQAASTPVAQAPSQAASMPGPLTSAITASRTMRAVQQQLAKAESGGLHKAAGSHVNGSASSETSSGAVDSPDHAEAKEDLQLLASTLERSCSAASTVKQHEQQHQTPAARALMQADGLLQSGPLSARVPRTASAGGMLGSPAAVRPGNSTSASAAAAAIPVEMAPLSARRREQMQQQQLSGPKGPGTPRVTTSRPQLPPKHRSSTSSLHKAPTAPAGAVLGTSTGVDPVMSSAQQTTSAEASHSSVAHAEPEQLSIGVSSHLYASPSAGDAVLLVPQHSTDTAGQLRPSRSSSSCGALGNSKVSVVGSYNRLQLSHEDIPLMSIKPTPGRLPMLLSSSRNGQLSTTISWQQRNSSDKQLIPAGNCAIDHSANPSTASDVSGSCRTADCGDARVGEQYSLQYSTMQSDMCNYASWLGGMGLSTRDLSGETSPVQQQQAVQKQQASRGSSLEASRTSSGLTAEQYTPPLGPQDSDLVVFSEPNMTSPVGCDDHKSLASTAEQSAAARVASAVSPSLQAGRSRARMSDWAYMSDMCNLGSIAVDGSSGLAAAMGHLAQVDRQREQTGHEADDEQFQQLEPQQGHEQSSAYPPPTASDSRATADDSIGSSQQQHQQPVRPSVASGSWPDANPSPADTLHATLDGQRASSTAGGAASPTAAGKVPNAADSLDSSAGLSRSNAAAEQQRKIICTTTGHSAATAPASKSRASSTAAARLDKETLAAVTGTTSREQLTASQEELAAKLAKLAFARKPTAKHQQQHNPQIDAAVSSQSSVQDMDATAASTRVLHEDFYPTMMSDMCNLAEPEEGEGLGALQEEKSNTSVDDTTTQQLLSQSKAATAAQDIMLQSFQQQHARPLPRRHYKPAGHCSGRASMQRKSLKIARSSAAGPLRSALLLRRGSAMVPPKPRWAQPVGGPTTAPVAVSPAAKHPAVTPGSAAGHHIESFDSYYPDCDLSLAANDVGGTVAGVGPDAPGKVTYVNPYYLYRDSTASSMVTGNTTGVSPPKSPKRTINRGHVAAAVAAIECQDAAAAAHDDGDDEVQSDLHLPWQQDNSRSTSPAVGVASSKGRWPVVDASVEARAW